MSKGWKHVAAVGAAALASAGSNAAWAAGGGAPHLDGGSMSIWWATPFVGILLSIALAPLFAPNFWHHHFGKTSLGWGLAFLAPFALIYGWELALYELLHVALQEYVPFIILLTALFTIAGGVRLTGSLAGGPAMNAAFLAIGAALASVMGTTGASMLLIRPLIRSNANRAQKVHTFVFFIFLVSNVGGSLTPLGDPPLFLGFLKGVSFFWPTIHLLAPTLTVAIPLLVGYYLLDSYHYARDPQARRADAEAGASTAKEPLRLEGKINLALLAAVIGAVLLGGVWKSGVAVEIFHVPVTLESLVTQAMLIGLTILSLKLTDARSRAENGFTWGPIVEVAKLFAAIFLTIIPAIAILKAGTGGALGAVVAAVNHDGQPIPAMYFWAAGILSSFLDNAPTYLIFFNAAGGDPALLMGDWATTLAAISAGAVFMGANTYIGNAPNFMVKAIAEERGVKMPSFFGYMLWSVGILVPLFVIVTFIWFR